MNGTPKIEAVSVSDHESDMRRRRIAARMALVFGSRIDGSVLGRIARAEACGSITHEQAIGLAAALLDATEAGWWSNLNLAE